MNMTFAVVAFTIIVQGITIKPLLRVLGLSNPEEDDYARARASHNAITSAISELEEMLKKHLISEPVYWEFHEGLSARLDEAKGIIQAAYAGDRELVLTEIQMAKVHIDCSGKKLGRTGTASGFDLFPNCRNHV